MDAPPAGRTPGGPAPLDHLRVPKLLEPYVLPAARAAAAQREQQIAAILNRIAQGNSRIKLSRGWNDPSFPVHVLDYETEKVLEEALRAPGPLGKLEEAERRRREEERQEELRRQSMRYLDDLAHTDAGFRLLSDLDQASHDVYIGRWQGPRNETNLSDKDLANAYLGVDGKPGSGGSVAIRMNPQLTTYALSPETEKPWMTERVQYGLYHELVHAWHATRGTLARDDHNGRPKAEFQAAGLGPWASEQVSENAIRRQMGKAERPDIDGVGY
jgi:hypothetical protein